MESSSDVAPSSSSRSAEEQKACYIADLQTYIACFNRGHWEGIRARLDENVQITVNGDDGNKLQGRDALRPLYQKDFQAGKQVAITKVIAVESGSSSSPEEVSIRVALEAAVPNDDGETTTTTCMEVVYTYSGVTMKQVRHEIFLLRDDDAENSKTAAAAATVDVDVEPLSAAAVGSQRAALRSWDCFMKYYDQMYMRQLAQLRQDEEEKPYANLAFGNPQDPPLPELLAALKRPFETSASTPPPNLEYKMTHPATVQAIVRSLSQPPRSLRVHPDDVFLTNGALAALSLLLFVLADPGQEVVLLTPKYFFYEPMAEFAGLRAVLVPACAETNFDVDVAAIRRAITPQTRAVLLNSPNNPTGRVYPPESLRALATMLQKVNEERRQQALVDNKNGSGSSTFAPIVVVSDEAYSRIVFDGIEYHSIAEVYPYSIAVYTWAKTLLCPSERFGYIALSPLMPATARQVLRDKIFRAQLVGWSFPNGSTLRAYAEIGGNHHHNLHVDNVARLQQRRDALCGALQRDGWKTSQPQGGFYLLVQVPTTTSTGLLLFRDEDDLLAALHRERVLALPGSMMDCPGWIRLSLTASDAMVELAVAAFRRVRAQRGVEANNHHNNKSSDER